LAHSEEILQLLKILALNYGSEPSEDKINLFTADLQDLPAEVMAQAVRRHMHASPFFPRLSELRQLAAQITAPADHTLSEGEIYWLAMGAYNATLRGELVGAELERRFGRVLRQTLDPP
jgi:hypothetical protein